jgi:hypothetical protein
MIATLGGDHRLLHGLSHLIQIIMPPRRMREREL